MQCPALAWPGTFFVELLCWLCLTLIASRQLRQFRAPLQAGGGPPASADDALAALRVENAELRQVGCLDAYSYQTRAYHAVACWPLMRSISASAQAVAGMLGSLTDEGRNSFLQQHAQLVAEAASLGEALPQITGEGVLPDSMQDEVPSVAAGMAGGTSEAAQNVSVKVSLVRDLAIVRVCQR